MVRAGGTGAARGTAGSTQRAGTSCRVERTMGMVRAGETGRPENASPGRRFPRDSCVRGFTLVETMALFLLVGMLSSVLIFRVGRGPRRGSQEELRQEA